jgi:hypothetical protein
MTKVAKAEKALTTAQKAYRAVEAKAMQASDPRAPEVLAEERAALEAVRRASIALEAAVRGTKPLRFLPSNLSPESAAKLDVVIWLDEELTK